MTIVTRELDRMIAFALEHKLLDQGDALFARNLLLDAVKLDAPEAYQPDTEPLPPTLTPMLDRLSAHATELGLIDDSGDARDRYATRLCGLLMPPPSSIRDMFYALLNGRSPDAATDWFYAICRASDYIRVDHIAKNKLFIGHSPYGDLEITINLSKPEKDPRDIVAQLKAPKLGYPTCMLCVENPGYAGRTGFPARQNHRMIPLTLGDAPWHMQYSPYLYYDEHCIVLNEKHTPMHIDRENMERMFEFVDMLPHYFIGSNADLPIVGGSILSHDHFQGGRHVFPMDLAPISVPLKAPVDGVEAGVVAWPMTCIRLRSQDKHKLIELGTQMLAAWRAYSDESLDILAHTDQPHNTITPTVRRDGDSYLLNLVLRNNRTTAEHPMGLFHPHADLHHIKKENIGLIEVMGLFILPGRLLSELDELTGYLTGDIDPATEPHPDSPLAKHHGWAKGIANLTGTALSNAEAEAAIQTALTAKCTRVLKDAGVYKLDEAGQAGLLRFLGSVGYASI